MTSDVSIARFSGPEYIAPPAGFDPTALWRVPVGGTIGYRNVDRTARHLNQLRMQEPGVMDQYLPEWEDQLEACPECSTRAGLTVVGRWGEPGALECPQGHTWNLASDEAATRLLQHLVGLAVERGLVATE